MSRLLILALVVALLAWLLLGRRRRVSGDGARAHPQKPQKPDAFTQCAHCGVHLPTGDAVLDGPSAYCSEAHRLAGPRR